MTAYDESMAALLARVEALESTCTELSGRVHGPQVTKAWVEKFTEEYIEHVDTLVKAAAQADAYFRAELAPTSDVLLFLDGVRDALEPFFKREPK
jgi:cytochrome c peroxidase